MKIHKIKAKPADRQRIAEQEGRQSGDEAEFDYSDVIVIKPWGYEFLIFENDWVAIWMLHIGRKRKTSMHPHPSKVTSLVLLSGEATCSHLEVRLL